MRIAQKQTKNMGNTKKQVSNRARLWMRRHTMRMWYLAPSNVYLLQAMLGGPCEYQKPFIHFSIEHIHFIAIRPFIALAFYEIDFKVQKCVRFIFSTRHLNKQIFLNFCMRRKCHISDLLKSFFCDFGTRFY